MNTKRRAKTLWSTAAGLGVIFMVSANPAMANDTHHSGHGYDRHYYVYDHHQSHHRPHHYRGHHVFTNYHSRRHYSAGYARGFAYSVVPYNNITYQRPVYHTGSGHRSNSLNFGNAAGGALGGYLGSKVGKGSGRLAATALGAVIGYSVGGHIGAQY